MGLFRRTMPEDAFWELVGVMGGRADEDAVEALTEALRARGRRSARPFAERLALVLHELDREVLFRQQVRFDDEDDEDLADDVEPLPLSDDSFLYLRAGVVARGRAVYEQVLTDPSALSRGTWPECEDLLYVADELVDGEVETRVSYETGSNEARWSTPPAAAADDEGPVPRAVWVDVRDLSEGFESEVHHADGRVETATVHGSPRWFSWSLQEELTTTLADLVTTDGRPPSWGTSLQVRLDMGEGWQPPRDEGVVMDDLFVADGDRRVGLVVDGAQVRAWDARVRREALLGACAAAVLLVLPEDHPAAGPLRDLRERGAEHLPG